MQPSRTDHQKIGIHDFVDHMGIYLRKRLEINRLVSLIDFLGEIDLFFPFQKLPVIQDHLQANLVRRDGNHLALDV